MSELQADLTGEIGYMSEADLSILRDTASLPRAGGLLNVGCYKGLSCSVLATVGPTLDCVDTFEGVTELPTREFFEAWTANMKACGVRERIRLFVGDSKAILPRLMTESYRLVFVDGGHDLGTVYSDLREAKRLVSKGGCVIFDDVNIDKDGGHPVRVAADFVFGIGGWTEAPNTKLGVWFKPREWVA